MIDVLIVIRANNITDGEELKKLAVLPMLRALVLFGKAKASIRLDFSTRLVAFRNAAVRKRFVPNGRFSRRGEIRTVRGEKRSGRGERRCGFLCLQIGQRSIQ